MRIIGFNFNKISIERKKKDSGKINIKTEIDVPEIKEVKSSIIKTGEIIVEVMFDYKIKYEPDFAEVSLAGNILITLEPKIAKDVLKQWKKKKIHEDFRIFLFNIILKKAALKALELEDELNLPLHMPMPSFKKQE